MIYCDNISEIKDGISLVNMVTSTTADGGWYTSNAGSYLIYSSSLSDFAYRGRKYYAVCKYKFTTTNQSPTWVTPYLGGYVGSGGITNPVAGTEYKISGLFLSTDYNSSTYTYNKNLSFYNGASNAIKGCTASIKEVAMYDVTDLHDFLMAQGLVGSSTSALKTWCDSNLTFVASNKTLLVTANSITKVGFNKGSVYAKEYIETDWMKSRCQSSTQRDNVYFDNGTCFSIYNNKGNGTVTHTRIDGLEQKSPFYPEHPYIMKIVTNGEASPGAGGFYCSHTASANSKFIEKFVAKIPVGYTVVPAYNPQGTGSSVSVIGNDKGTGDWEEYSILYKCGSTGSFSSGGHVYINGSNNTNVTWYVAACMNCTITDDEDLKNFTLLPKMNRLYGARIFTSKIDNASLLSSSNLSKTDIYPTPQSGWYWDTEDIPTGSQAKASLVQSVGAYSFDKESAVAKSLFTFRIDPCVRYKLSMWVKCKNDMSSFLVSNIYRREDMSEYGHTSTVFVPGTKGTLASDLVAGATSFTLTDTNVAKNWVARSYSRIGVRTGSSVAQDRNSYISNSYSVDTSGLIAGNDGNVTVNLKEAYTGKTITKGSVVVESYDGGTYPYPFGKGNLPSDNTWKYVETTFGRADDSYAIWDGRSTGGWKGIPAYAQFLTIQLNLYTNNGTVPLKFADVRLTPVSSSKGRAESKIVFLS